MAIDMDDLLTPKPKVPTVNLESLGIAELEAHIAALVGEIERARAVIAAKEKQRKGAEALFKK